MKLFTFHCTLLLNWVLQIAAKNARFVKKNTSSTKEERVFRAIIFTTNDVQKLG